MSSASRSGSHFNSSRTSRSISLSDFMVGSWFASCGLGLITLPIVIDLMSDRARGHDDGQLPPQVYRRSYYKAQFAGGAADVAMLSAGDKGSCWIDGDRS